MRSISKFSIVVGVVAFVSAIVSLYGYANWFQGKTVYQEYLNFIGSINPKVPSTESQAKGPLPDILSYYELVFYLYYIAMMSGCLSVLIALISRIKGFTSFTNRLGFVLGAGSLVLVYFMETPYIN